MSMEKEIKNFPGYTITDDGKVISYKFKEPKIMKTWLQQSGYENIKLCKENQTYHFLIHRLVAEAFIPNPNNLPEVNHKNKIRNDLEFYIPQLCSFMLFGEYEIVQEFFSFLCKSCYASFSFAHRIIWFLKSSIADNQADNEKIRNMLHIIQTIFKSSFNKDKLESLYFT